VEGCFESGKLKYYLDLIMAQLAIGTETSIAMAFLGMRIEKILRLLYLYFCHYLCLVLHLAIVRLPLDGAEDHLPA
jgi:hypothetical protein